MDAHGRPGVGRREGPAERRIGVGLGAVGGGQLYDSSLSVRNFFFTGGAMFSVGSAAYALIHPEAASTQIMPGLNLNPGGEQGQP